jgi:hypothetical protein
MAILTLAGTYFTPQSNKRTHEKKYDDIHLEIVRQTAAGSLTLGTDTSVVNNAAFAYAQNATGTAAAAGVSTPGSGAVSTTVVTRGAAGVHDVFIFGGERGIDSGTGFYFGNSIGQESPSDFVWELVKVTLDDSGDGTVNGSEESTPEMSIVARPMFVMATQVLSASLPSSTGVSVASVTSIDFVLKSANDAVVLCLVGGLKADSSPVDDSGTNIAVREDMSFLLHNAKNVYSQPRGALIGEIIDATLADVTSYSAVTIAASSLTYISHIEGIFPMDTNASQEAAAWNGTRGTSSGIVGANGSVHVMKCLVVGY